MANPKFYELQRLRKSTWDIPRFIQDYDLTLDDRLILPRGLRHTITTIVERAGSQLAVTDARNPETEIDTAFTAELTGKQSSAVGALLAHDDGILVAPPGSGKTVMACAVIAERNTSTLVLVDRKALADQWRTRISQLGPVRHTLTDEEQGTIAAAMHADAGPRRTLLIHETTFQPGDVDLDAPGALAEVHRRLALDESRNARIADDVVAALTLRVPKTSSVLVTTFLITEIRTHLRP